MSDSSSPGAGETAEPREGTISKAPAAKKRSRRPRRASKPKQEAQPAGPPGGATSFGGGLEPAPTSEAAPPGEAPEQPKKRASKRRPRRKKSGSQSSEKAEASASEAPKQQPEEPQGEASGADAGEEKPRRRRGTRGGRRRKSKRAAPEADAEAKDEDAEKPTEAKAARKKAIKKTTRRGGKKRRSRQAAAPVELEVIPGEDDDLPELAELPAEAELVSGSSKKRKKRRGKKKAGGEAEAAPLVVEEVPRDEVILVNAADKLESRVAVVRNERIGELFLEVNRVQSYVHNIYRGKVVNIESAIGAAFVDFGQGKNGFLHVSDVLPEYGDPTWSLPKLLEARTLPNDDVDLSGVESDLDEGKGDDGKKDKGKKDKGGRGGKGRGRKGREGSRPQIGDLLKVGDKVVVQITKDAIGDKGPALTTYISIPGRFLVLMPSLEMVGVSRKIEDEKERKRLRKIMQSFNVPGGMGLIVRTAGIGKTKADLKRDLDYLLALWDSFSKRLLHGKTPCALYQENDLAIRTMRDMFTRRTSRVVVDDEAAYNSMREFAEKLMPEHVERIERHDGHRPVFHSFGVEQDYEKIFVRRVELPSGGSIVIDQTEALVAIDVNSGRTRGDGAVFEDIALKTNLEAVAEIALQIKLRDLGGILVLDFIDMMRKSSRLAVERALRDAMHTDRARHKVGRISQFGLLELTRQRLGPGLSKLLYTTCLTCRGTGRQRTPEARSQGILRRLGSALTQKGFTKVEVRSQPEVIAYLKGHCMRDLDALAAEHKRELTLIEAPDQLEESVLRYLRADGREVRPGGRRKKR